MVRHTSVNGARAWVYAKRVTGRFQRLHRASGVVLIGILAVVPWLSVAGQPVFRIDLPARHLTAFGTVFTAADGFNLVLLALLAAFSLFFFTALLGRLWCGWLCPQTVFLEELVRPIERWFEGDRRVRMVRDAGPWTVERVSRKGGKWAAFGLLAFVVSMMALSLFTDPRLLWTGQAGPATYSLVGIGTFGLFVDWAWFREQLCIYLCPYARFQGALTDEHSLVVSYDQARGEPRGRGRDAAREGHCISCDKCVDVCPQGIDIRDGFQLECINCSRCVDACEDVMGRLGQPPLVRYSTIASDEGRTTHWVRGRIVAYAAILLALTAGLAYRVLSQQALEATVNRMPGSLFVQDDDGFVRNTYLVSIHNTDARSAHDYVVTVRGLPEPQVTTPPLSLEPLTDGTVPLVIRLPNGATGRTAPFVVAIDDGTHELSVDATFKAPPRGGLP